MSSRAPLDLYAAMYLIRRVEERLIDEYGSRRIRMPLHLSIGQEGVAVGVFGALRRTDTTVGTHRSHAFYLAKGGPLQPLIDEFYSLPTGCSQGRGGSMHLTATDVGFLGSSAVLGGGVPIAVGTALAHRRTGRGDVAVAVTGDGGADEGSLYESLNLAALLELPVLFLVENNGYSTLTPQSSRQALPDIAGRARAFGVDAVRLDADDALAFAPAVTDLVARIRTTSRPVLVEAVTFRHSAHVGVVSDWGSGRPPELLEAWESRDPLRRLEAAYTGPEAELDTVRASVDREVEAAFASAIERFERTNAVAGLAAPPAPSPTHV